MGQLWELLFCPVHGVFAVRNLPYLACLLPLLRTRITNALTTALSVLHHHGLI